jgi:glycosyltransferase involved in cell wall biosynthesis
LKDKKVITINNGIDSENVFFPRNKIDIKNKFKLEGKKVILAVVPTMSEEIKGGKFIGRIYDELKNENIVFLVVGLNGISIERNDKLIKMGRIENPQNLAELYSAADLFLLLSKKETFSLVTAESLSCGTPVIGFNSGAPIEIAKAGYGKFVEYANVNELVNTIKSFLNNELIFFNQEECHNYIKLNFSQISMYNKFLETYSNFGRFLL